MGKFILCSGKRAKTPFFIETTSVNVYTIEELCYYLYHNIYLVSVGLFNCTLIEWIQNEVQMQELAEKLKGYQAENARMKEYVVTILCSTDYFNMAQVKELITVIDQIEGLPFIKRRKLRADKYLDYKKYMQAAKEYSSILENREASMFTSIEYGNLLHNFAISLLHVGTFREACVKFEEAYQHNQNPETLKLYLMMLKMLKTEEEFDEKLRTIDASVEEADSVTKELDSWGKNVKKQTSYQLVHRLEQLKENQDAAGFFREVEDVLEKWTEDYRKKIS